MAGRNAAELRAAATATGLFNGPRRQYVGNGYSVPWSVATYESVPDGFTMWSYKAYLDANYLEYSRLHDWLYTPYGKLINCTQVEADDALQEELNTVSPVDAVIVGNACRYFGAPFFGRSQVGYFGEQGTVLANNMGLAERQTLNNGDSPVPTKIVILFQQTTGVSPDEPSVGYSGIQRTAGWSESLYGPDNIASLISLLKGPRAPGVFPLLQARANILCNEGSIIGVRLYQGGAGKGQLLSASYSGQNGTADQPGASLQISATSTTTGQSRRWLLRGQVDNDIVAGEWDPDNQTVTRYTEYFASLAGLGWMAQTNTGQVNIFNISVAGLVTTTAPAGFAVGQIVTLKNVTLDSTGNRIGGKYVVSAIGPLGTNFTIAGWLGISAQGGTAGITGSAFQDFAGATMSVVRTSFRKVGRPFAGYRGRRSRRRVTA